MAEAQNQIRVLFTCTGIGIMNRGIETFFREAFDGLKNLDGIQLRLVKGAGDEKPDEHVVWNLARTGLLAACFSKIAHRTAYTVEQWSSLLPVARHIRRYRPHVVFYSDSNLGFLLYRARKLLGVPFRLLFSNGGPCHPPFVRTDFVQQVAPVYYQEALRAGEPEWKHFLVPYGIAVNAPPRPLAFEEKRDLRRRLQLPAERTIVLSVGWISRQHKRADYLIQELARLPRPRPFLQLLGAVDRGSQEVLELAKRLLGPDGFAACSVPYEQVPDYYRAADCFVLASLSEGFGRVYLEALMHGLPVVAHHFPVSDYVLGKEARLGDLSREGALSEKLEAALAEPLTNELMQRRWQTVRERFSWPKLAAQYQQMFTACAANRIR